MTATTLPLGKVYERVLSAYSMVHPSRRRALAVSGSAALSALAGCLQSALTRTAPSSATTTTEPNESTTTAPSSTPILDASEFRGADGGARIQAAVDALPREGGTVYVPPEGPDADGKWYVSAPIDPPSNARLRGVPGETTLHLADGTNDDVIQTAADATGPTTRNLRVEGFVVEGNRAANSDAEPGTAGKVAGIRIIDAENVVVQHCHATDCYGHGVEVKRSVGVTVRDCTAAGNGDDGFSVSDVHFDAAGTEHVTVADCAATGNADSGFEVDDGPRHVAVRGCVAERNTDGFCVHTHVARYAPAAPEHVLVEGCVARQNADHGFVAGNHSSGRPAHYTFRDVRAVGNGKAGFALHPAGASPSSVPLADVRVEGFYVEGSDASRPVVSCRYADTVRDLTIRDGTVTGVGASGLSFQGTALDAVTVENVHVDGGAVAGHGVDLRTGSADVSDVRIRGCEIHGAGEAGVACWASGGEWRRARVAGNRCYNNGQDASAPDSRRAGISLSADGSRWRDVSVVDNTCFDDQPTPTQVYGIYHRGGRDATYAGNVLRGNARAGFGGAAVENSAGRADDA